jgi:hypothetical protein
MKFRTAILLLLCLGALPAVAQPVLRWAPADTTVDSGQEATLALMLDDTLTVRTLEFFIEYDADILTTVGGEPGALFQGFNLFWGFEEVDGAASGQRHGYCVVLGADDWALGPGELFTWTVRASQAGTAELAALSVQLLPPGSGEYEDVQLPPATVTVVGTSPAPLPPPVGPRLSLHPNPFNPRTTIGISGAPGQAASLDVFDLQGRRLGRLWQGDLDRGGAVDWDGRDAAGRLLPSGVYTFVLTGSDGSRAWTRGTLIR